MVVKRARISPGCYKKFLACISSPAVGRQSISSYIMHMAWGENPTPPLCCRKVSSLSRVIPGREYFCGVLVPGKDPGSQTEIPTCLSS